MALVRVYCGLASAYPPRQLAVGSSSLSATIVDDAGRVLDVCDVGDDSYGYAYLSTLLAERATGPYSVAVATDSEQHLTARLLITAGWTVAVVEPEATDDFADRFADPLTDEVSSAPSQRRALGLARALQAGALSASLLPAAPELTELRPVLAALNALANGRQGAAVALREVLRELYPAALRAYADPADPVALAVVEALPEPGTLSSSAGRGRDALEALTAQLTSAGVGDQAAITEAITALRVAVAETPRRGGVSRAFAGTVAETVRQAVAAVRACDTASSVLVAALAERAVETTLATAPPQASAPPAAPAARSTLPTRLPNQRPAPAKPLAPAAPTAPAPRAAGVPRPRSGAPAANPVPPTDAPTAPPGYAVAPPHTPPAVAQPASTAPAPGQPVAAPPPAPQHAAAAASQFTAPAHRTASHSPQSYPEPMSHSPAGGYAAPDPSLAVPAVTAPAPPAASPAPAPGLAQPLPAGSRTPARAPAGAVGNGFASPAAHSPAAHIPGAHSPAAPEPASGYLANRPVSTPPPPPPGITPIQQPRARRQRAEPDQSDLQVQVPLSRPLSQPPPTSRSAWPTSPPSDEWAGSLPGLSDPPSYASGNNGSTVRNGGDPHHGDRDSSYRGESRSESWSPRNGGGVVPPWRADDLRPPEPPMLRLVEPTLPPELRDELGLGTGSLAEPPPLRLVQTSASAPRSAPPVSADDDDNLLIFAQTRSAWFDHEPESATWQSAMDFGWRAAEQAAEPTVGDRTGAGLPRRVPHANLVPGAPPQPEDRQLRVVRDPASIAAHTSGYFSGWRRGQEVGGFPVGSRPRRAAGAWEFHRDDDRLSG